MKNRQMDDYYKKFPVALRDKLISGHVKLPRGAQFEYGEFLAYRGITREENDYTPVNANDMKSYFEEGRRPRGVNCSDSSYYAVSLYKSFDMLKQCFKFPRPHKKIAQGYVYMDGGPQYTAKDSHVDWWLYENVSFDKFVIKEKEDFYE